MHDPWGEVRVQRQVFGSDLGLLVELQGWFENFCQQHPLLVQWDITQRYRFKLAMVEGFTNTVRHAHQHLPSETEIEAEIALWVTPQAARLTFRIWDCGAPFDPTQLEEPEPGTLQLGGYGWFLLRRLCDRVTYDRGEDDRNCLTISNPVPMTFEGQV
ncbi:MAG: ATP-binding protein [Oscillatoriales cyanobacterium]|nr:MAG: ATP-binding protein [Oscillatoriales cyanobacterium]